MPRVISADGWPAHAVASRTTILAPRRRTLGCCGRLTLADYFFGNIPAAKNNLTLIIVGIIVVSLLPAMRELIRHRR